MRSLRKRIGMLLVSCMLLTAGVAGSSSSADAKSGTWKHNKAGYWYEYADGSYAMNQWLQYDGKWYYFNAKGYMQTGWLKKGGKWYYFNPKTGAMVTGWKKIDGKYYFFKTDGTMAVGEYCHGYWLNKNGTCTSEAKASWRKSGKNWWFGDTNGWYAKKQWIKIDGKTYYFDAKGYLVTNQWIGKYCVGADGSWVPDASTDWAAAYLNEVYNFSVSDQGVEPGSDRTKFALIYSDNDSTPELIMAIDCHAGTPETVVTYKNGQVIKSTIGFINYCLEYIPRTGLLFKEFQYKFYEYCFLYQLSEDGFTLLAKGDGITAEDAKNASMGPRTVTEYWRWNDQYVTQSEYQSNINKLYKNKGKKGSITYLSYTEMCNLLESYLDY
ncbi:MAG: hypothetical protein IJM25_12210 [Eubacterium sp.]|nr:hypothetical protein [Eubacterium sp.]